MLRAVKRSVKYRFGKMQSGTNGVVGCGGHLLRTGLSLDLKFADVVAILLTAKSVDRG